MSTFSHKSWNSKWLSSDICNLYFLSFFNTISWFGAPDFFEIYLRCIVLMIWDMTTIYGIRYVIERSLVRVPLGCAIFHVITLWLFQGHSFFNLYRYICINIYICIYILHCFDDLIHDHHQWNPKWPKKLISSINLQRVINPNSLWWSHHIRLPRNIFDMELSHCHMNKKQKALAPPNDLASIVWMNEIAIISNRNVKRRFRSVDTVVENFTRCQTKIIGASMYYWTSCTWIRQLLLGQGCISQIFILRQFRSLNFFFLSSTGNNFLSTHVCNWSYTFPQLTTDQLRLPVWPNPCPQ